jgi:hypothetical protein
MRYDALYRLSVRKAVDFGACRKVPVLGRDSGLDGAETWLEGKTKLLWNDGDLGEEKFGGSDGKKRLTSRAFAECSRGRDGHLIPSASQTDGQVLPTWQPICTLLGHYTRRNWWPLRHTYCVRW